MKEKKWEIELAECGDLHNEDCCVNFEDSRACDVDTGIVDCCENMRYISELVRKVSKEYSDWKIKECLPEKRGTANYTNSNDVIMHSGYDDGWNACIDQILINKDNLDKKSIA